MESRTSMRNLLFPCVLFGAPVPASAELHALSQAELRAAVSEERALAAKSIIGKLPGLEKQDVLDLRVFEVADALVYRIVHRGEGDHVSSTMINAMTGEEITPNSLLGRAIWGCDQTQCPPVEEDRALRLE